jgi:uncharacterized damage-inducible protein DinB
MGDGFDIMLAMTSDHLRTILGHLVWATLLLLDRCATLTPDELQLTAPGTYGSIHATLGHLVAADRRYLVGITGGERVSWRLDDPPPVAALREEAERQRAGWSDVLDRIDEVDCTMPEIEGIYPRIEHAVGLFLLQAVHHGENHRTHVCSILGAHGLEVPELSGWDYVLVLRG